MRNRPLFIKIRDFFVAQDATAEQIQEVTAAQIINALNLDADEISLLQKYGTVIRRLCAEDRRAYDRRQRLLTLLSKLTLAEKRWLRKKTQTEFPSDIPWTDDDPLPADEEEY